MGKPPFDKKLFMLHGLLLFYPVLYFMQQNVAEYSGATYGKTLLYVFFYALGLLPFYALSLKFSSKVLHGIYILLLSIGLCLVLGATLLYADIVLLGVVFVLICVSYLLHYVSQLKPALFILSLMSLFSIGLYLYPIFFVTAEKRADS
mgnify:CR=1 FL=1